MAGHRSEKISVALSFTDIPLPYFKEKMFEVFQMIFAWNQHMNDSFIPLWVSCLDDSIYILNKNFNCLGWTFVPGMSYPKLNEYCTICFRESIIVESWGLVEGKHIPKELGIPEFETRLLIPFLEFLSSQTKRNRNYRNYGN